MRCAVYGDLVAETGMVRSIRRARNGATQALQRLWASAEAKAGVPARADQADSTSR